MSTNQQILPKVKIVPKDWMPENQTLFIYNGVERVVKHDLTGKEGVHEIKKPRVVVLHHGPTPFLQRLKHIWRRRHAR